MKRSQMVEIGISRLKKLDNSPLNNFNFQEDDFHFVVNSILNSFEEAGMVPPKTTIFINTTLGKAYGECVPSNSPAIKMLKNIRKWTPEHD